jgi:phage baseplate assembly protein gpV
MEARTIERWGGARILFDDAGGREVLSLEVPSGQTVTFDYVRGSVEVRDASGNAVVMEPAGVTVTSSAKVTLNASTVEISAGMVTVNAGMSRFSGVVQADTLIANSVVGANYTPGAGNIW